MKNLKITSTNATNSINLVLSEYNFYFHFLHLSCLSVTCKLENELKMIIFTCEKTLQYVIRLTLCLHFISDNLCPPTVQEIFILAKFSRCHKQFFNNGYKP